LSITDRLRAWVFSDISLSLILPCIIGVLILAYPTVIADFLRTIHMSLPPWLWGAEEIPLQYILQYIFVIGLAQSLLVSAIPIFLGLVWNRWAGGASGFLLSLLFTVSMATYYPTYYGNFIPNVTWLSFIVSGMLAGYIAGALMERSRMRGNTSLKTMLIWSIVAAIVAIVFTTQTYIWYSPMFNVSISGMSYINGVTFSYFIYTVIYCPWAILAAIAAKVASQFR
jgi:uncharacterized membrane protein YeaQ/YmgE (transglycosylase-associated protein family)